MYKFSKIIASTFFQNFPTFSLRFDFKFRGILVKTFPNFRQGLILNLEELLSKLSQILFKIYSEFFVNFAKMFWFSTFLGTPQNFVEVSLKLKKNF